MSKLPFDVNLLVQTTAASLANSLMWRDDFKLPDLLFELEQRIVVDMLDLCMGNKSEVAKRLGISRTKLHYLIKAYKLKNVGNSNA